MKTKEQKGYITIGVLFLVAGLAMLLAEYSTDTTLDVPDVYAGSELSDTISISSTCSPVGNQFSVPTNVAIVFGFTSSEGALSASEGNSSATVVGGINCAGCTQETSMVVNSAGIVVAQDGANFGSYHTLLANGFRTNRNVQCLGMSTPYAEVQMNISNASWVINISAENVSNAEAAASHVALGDALAYIIGSAGTGGQAVIVDNSVAEIVSGGATNMNSGFGWSLLLQRDIGIGRASAGTGLTINLQSELGQVQ